MATIDRAARTADPARPRGRLHARGGRGAPRLRGGADRRGARARVALLVRPGEHGREHRALHGVAQVPIGVAGPLLVDGEHAQGEFYVPLATAEGTLVASYNRGMKTAPRGRRSHDHGDGRRDAARAGVRVRERPRGARLRRVARREPSTTSRRAAETTTRSGKLRDIEQYSASRILFTRFNYTTGDAAGQNLTGKATAAACAWITSNYEGIEQLLPRVELRDRQEELAGEHAAHARQAGGGGGDVPARADPRAHALHGRAALRRAPGVEPRRVHVGREQQRRALGQRHHRAVHRDRPGRGERGGVVGGVRLLRAAAERRLLLLGHDPVADRRHLRRRHRPRHPARVPRDARLLRRAARCASSPRSSPPRCSAASCRSARRSWPRSGSRRTTCSAATVPRPATRRRRAASRRRPRPAGSYRRRRLPSPAR